MTMRTHAMQKQMQSLLRKGENYMSLENSNRLPVLADEIRQATSAAKAASVEAAGQYLEAGRLLVEAKAACAHGEWGAFLESAGVPERQAQRLMKLARSGLKPDTVSELGGVKAALEYLAARKLPGRTEAMCADTGHASAIIWQDQPGYFHSIAIDTQDPDRSICVWTDEPVTGEPVKLGDGSFTNPLWLTVEEQLGGLPASLTTIPGRFARKHIAEFQECAETARLQNEAVQPLADVSGEPVEKWRQHMFGGKRLEGAA
jgi:hypothetical protein